MNKRETFAVCECVQPLSTKASPSPTTISRNAEKLAVESVIELLSCVSYYYTTTLLLVQRNRNVIWRVKALSKRNRLGQELRTRWSA